MHIMCTDIDNMSQKVDNVGTGKEKLYGFTENYNKKNRKRNF